MLFGCFGTQAVSQGRSMCEFWWAEWNWERFIFFECIAIPCQACQSTNAPFSYSIIIDAVHAFGSVGNTLPSTTEVLIPKTVLLFKEISFFVRGWLLYNQSSSLILTFTDENQVFGKLTWLPHTINFVLSRPY